MIVVKLSFLIKKLAEFNEKFEFDVFIDVDDDDQFNEVVALVGSEFEGVANVLVLVYSDVYSHIMVT